MVIETISNKAIAFDYTLDPNSVPGVVQQARMLISTERGTVPLDRGYGLDPKAIDKPSNILVPGLKVDIQQQFKKYIPKLVILGLDAISIDGKIEIKLKVGIKDE